MRYCFIIEKDNSKGIKSFIQFDDTIYINKNLNNLSIKRKIGLAKKIKKYLEKEEIEKIILSKELKRKNEFIECLEMQGIKRIDGKILMKYLTNEIVEHILKYENKEKKETRIAILSNELTDTVIEIIRVLVPEYKEVTIITNHQNKIMNLEKELYELYGTSLIITNNKKKALLKQDLILNFDFIEEIINKFNINNEAIIVNFEDKIKIENKRFTGINIYDYEITYNDETEEEHISYDKKDIIEGEINFNTTFFYIRKFIKHKEINIKTLITYRGNII